MHSDHLILEACGRVLDPDGPIVRDHVRKPDRRTQQYLERFDRTTLYYDCVYLAERRSYLFTAPRFLNLWRPFRQGLRVNGKKTRAVTRRKWLRCEQVEVHAPRGSLTLDWQGETAPVAFRDGIGDCFAGLNCLVAVNKNNRLDWIADWAAYYAQTHGAEGVVLFDNGSTDYTLAEVNARLSQVRGLARSAVISAPYPYGPTDRSRKLEVSPRFFQTAMLNIGRRDPLARARAVLSVDIDEIARKADDAPSIFDLAVGNMVGMATLNGVWVYPDPDTDGPVGHAAHGFRRSPDRPCNRKWCLRPGGVQDRFGWAVHHIGGPLQDLFTNQTQVSLLHCRGTSTGWKRNRFSDPGELLEDPELETFWNTRFPKPAAE
ncbi:hypothetical protein [Fluviibacterium sp. S390]|uniref:hypothetical protein n=1 Tax=Fluviibacterium sp. S390 TaxID=3415139 RepID=UPI003C7B56F3